MHSILSHNKACGSALIFLFALIVMLSTSRPLKAQSTCQTAVPLALETSCVQNENLHMQDSVFWLQFEAVHSAVFLSIMTSDSAPHGNISGIQVYGDSCENLQFLLVANNELIIDTNIFQPGNQYFIKISDFSGTGGWFGLKLCSYDPDWGICAFVPSTLVDKCLIETAIGNTHPDPNDNILAEACIGDTILFRVNNALYNKITNYYYSSSQHYEFVFYNSLMSMTSSPPIPFVPCNNWPDPQQTYARIFLQSGYYKVFLRIFENFGFQLFSHGYYWIHILDGPDVSPSSNSPVCLGDTIKFTVINNNIPVLWSGPDSFSTTEANPSIPDCSFANGGWYYVYTDDGHCHKLDSIFVDIQEPVVTAASNSPVCEGQQVQLTASSLLTGTYYWAGPGGFHSNAQNPLLMNVTEQQSGVYYLTFTSEAGCQAFDSVTVAVLNNYLDAEITGNNNNCDSLAHYEIAGGNAQYYYSWSVDSAWAAQFVGPSSGVGVSSVWILWSGSPAGFPATLSVTMEFGENCETTLQKTVFPCCRKEYDVLWSNFKLLNDTTFSNLMIQVNGDLLVAANIIIHDSDNVPTTLNMGPMSRIIILPGYSFTITGNVIIQQSCQYMWDGIYVSDSGCTLTCTGSTYKPVIRDACNAVVSRYGGLMHLIGARFLYNYISIKMTDYYSGVCPGYEYPYPGYISGCEFNTVDTAILLPYKPHLGVPSNTGIELNRVDGVLIGGIDHYQGNYFSNLLCGIRSVNSRTEVYRNYFLNIPVNSKYVYPPEHAAVFSVKKLREASPFVPDIVVGDSDTTGNEFHQSSMGVFTQNQTSLVSWNQFYNTSNSIFCLNPKYPAWIHHNTIETQNLSYDMTGTGIQVKSADDYHAPTELNLWIHSNIISGIQNGISVINQHAKPSSSEISHNSIRFIHDLSYGTRRTGINVENSDRCIIEYDTVYRVNSSLSSGMVENIRGLRISRTYGAWVFGNSFTHLGSGVFTNGELFNTQFPCNQFIDSYHGFYFGPYTAMTDQGVLGQKNTHNGFYGNWTAPQYRLSTGPGFWAGPPVNWYVTSNPNDVDHLLDPNLGFYLHPCYPNILSIPNGLNHDCERGPFLPGECLDTTDRESYFGRVLRNENQYALLEAQYQCYEKEMLYQCFLRDPSLLSLGGSDDEAYRDLFDSLSQEDPGLREKIVRCFHEMKIDSASFYSQLLHVSDQWMANLRTVYEVYGRTWAVGDYALSTGDSALLMQISLMTPYEAGDATYTARVMLGIDPESYGTPYRLQTEKEGDTEVCLVRLWPNPANGSIEMEVSSVPRDPILILFRNVTGSLVASYKQDPGELRFSIQTERLPSGFYEVGLWSGSKPLGHHKMVIVH